MSTANLEALILSESQLISDRLRQIAQSAGSEEDIRHQTNTLLEAFISKAGLGIFGKHEYGLAGGRIDSKYAGVIIEYKSPKGKDRLTADPTSAGTKAVTKQIKRRFADFEHVQHIPPDRIFGVGTSGDFILFVRSRGGQFETEDPQPTTAHMVERLLRALVSLGAQGKSFVPDQLAIEFGADSAIAQKGVRQLYATLCDTKDSKARTFFQEWQILFSEVCGYDVHVQSDKVKNLARHYGLPKTARPAELLFAVHSYYAIFMKFLAAEIASSFSPLATSTLKKCIGAPTAAALRRAMDQLEHGGIWNQLGIVNFLEGDLFSWYLAAWDTRVADTVWDIVKQLDGYDPTTLSVEPGESRDLLKKLYQQLFPKSVRHDLGEYYTPDWLAEHVINDSDTTEIRRYGS